MRLLLLASLWSQIALAQVPMKLAYQGRLIKADGTPENGTLAMQFSLHDGITATPVLWTETQSVAVQNGYYAVFLGEATALPANLFDGRDLFLGVSVQGNALSPRQRIASVAYAIRAGQTSVSRDATLVGDGASAPLGVDPTQMQRRVTQACTGGTFVTGIQQDGSVTCGTPPGGGGGNVPVGTVAFFNLGACPSGWTELTAARGRYLVGLPAGGALLAQVGTALTDSENRAVGQHGHSGSTATAGDHTHSVAFSPFNAASGGTIGLVGGGASVATTGTAGAHTHTVSIQDAGTVAGTNAPYLQLLACERN